ncbi:hypothetical protein SDJN02_01538, partial [Cucurbita argyrosperma subsp. argyrosperma]
MAQLAASCGFGYPATDPPLINCLPASWISVKWAVLSQPMAQKPSLDCSGPSSPNQISDWCKNFKRALSLSRSLALVSPSLSLPLLFQRSAEAFWRCRSLICLSAVDLRLSLYDSPLSTASEPAFADF